MSGFALVLLLAIASGASSGLEAATSPSSPPPAPALASAAHALASALRPPVPQQDRESYRMARSLALRGRADRALRLLAAELEGGFSAAVVLADPAWNDLRTDSRFRQLVRGTSIGSESWIAPEGEDGEPLLLELAFESADAPLAGRRVYAYQTGADGRYSATDDNRNPRLYAYAVTDEAGQVILHTVVPGSYPGQTVPRHVHLEVDGRAWVGEVFFDSDPLLDEAARASARRRGWPVVTIAEGRARATLGIEAR